jgi:predicted ATP-binding protein involved in virulence
MIVENLTVEQYRGFTARTSIDFDGHLTVLVGENGVGKTSVLWALRVLLSHTLTKPLRGRSRSLYFSADDITRAWPYLRAEVAVSPSDVGEIGLKCTVQKNLEPYVKSTERDGRPREHAVDTPDRYEVVPGKAGTPALRSDSIAPLAVYYSAHRSYAFERGARIARAAVGSRAAYAEALDDRRLDLTNAAALWHNESELQKSDGRPARANQAIARALPEFLGEFQNIRVVGEEKPRLVVDKQTTTLDLSQLSDGERGVLAVLIDLTRRLAIANPKLDNPARDGQAVVLIDELDLHLHPSWQRTIASKLTATFPNCQLITTTHSPQIVGEIQPENLLLLRQEGDRIVSEKCGQAYGLDTNYVLQHIMGAISRAEPAERAIHAVEDALETGDLPKARSLLRILRTVLHGDDPVVVNLEAKINNLEALGNETDLETR